MGLIVKVDVPVPLIVILVSEAPTPAGVARVNATVEPNPFRSLRLIVEVPVAPTLIERLDGVAERLKSSKLNETVVV